jgi:hypothetical protein
MKEPTALEVVPEREPRPAPPEPARRPVRWDHGIVAGYIYELTRASA